VTQIEPLIAPAELHARLPAPESATRFVASARAQVEGLLRGDDSRILAVVGPCSIHDPTAALEYATKLKATAERLADDVLICMRVYFEKPRTTIGWKGLINDPHLDGSCDVAEGLARARTLLLELAQLGIPTATETLDPIAPQYLADLISWTTIGARTTESQTHREMASGLSMPVGFKNGTDGGLEVAIHAMQAARAPHSFIGLDADGRAAVVRTAGNPYTHAVLRGGSRGPNYEKAHVARASEQLAAAGCNSRAMIDCSHGNSGKSHERMPAVMLDVTKQLEQGSEHVLGVMLESHLVAGKQDLVAGKALTYGQSITDGCIAWSTTDDLLDHLALAARQPHRKAHREESLPPSAQL
jgi:3-deoxy-7-phosphoheptulonate synthase